MESTPVNPTIPEEVDFILSKTYKNVSSVNQEEYFGKIRRGLELLPIDDNFFKVIESLIKFFKFGILLLLKKPFQSMIDNPQLPPERQADMKKIAKIAHDIIGYGQIKELNFLFAKGVDSSFYKKIEIKEEKKKFIEYIKQLSAMKQNLYDKIQDKTITQEDIMAFQSKTFGKDLMYLDNMIESEIKISLKDIQAKYEQIVKEKKKKLKQAAEERDRQEQAIIQNQAAKESETTGTAPKQDQDKMVCCRKSFFHKEVILQPQSIHFVYRFYNDIFRSEHHFDILKTICGLLNTQGGYLLLGIKEDRRTYKRQAEGYTLTQKDKVEFKDMIDHLVEKCIQPSVLPEIMKIQFVPLRIKETNSFVSGKYIVKISVRYGERKEFYSFKEFIDSKRENFSVRTDNDTKIITSAQEILTIYKTRLLETPPIPAPIHSWVCPYPDNGSPIFE